MSPSNNTFGGIDVPSLLAAAADSKGDDENKKLTLSDLHAIIEAASKSASDPKTIEAANDLGNKYKKSWGQYGTSSTVVIVNKTAAELRLDLTSLKSGNLVKDSTYPPVIAPGGVGVFCHTSLKKDNHGASKGLVSYQICACEEKGTWVDCGQSLAFGWNTPEGPAGTKYENKARWKTADHARYIQGTRTIYDGTKIVGKFHIDDDKGTSPTYTFTFTQEEIAEGEGKGKGPFGGACVVM